MDIKQNLTVINQFKGRFGYNIKAIIMHSCVGTYQGSITWFKNPKAQASANYVIKRDGEITLCVPEENAAWQVGMTNQELNYSLNQPNVPDFVRNNTGVNLNFISLGIELEDNKDKNWPYPSPQYDSCVWLVADICRRYSLPVDRQHILTHKSVNPLNRSDPIGKWNHDKFIQDVGKLLEVLPKGGVDQIQINNLQDVVEVSVSLLNIRSVPKRILPLAGKRTVCRGTDLDVVGFCEGEDVGGNNLWYKLADGNFVWAGGTNKPMPELPDGNKKKDMTEEEKNLKLAEFETRKGAIQARKDELEVALQANAVDAENFKHDWEAFAALEVLQPVVAEPVVEAPAEELGGVVADLAAKEAAEKETVETVVTEPESTPVVEPDLKAQFNAALEELKAKFGL